MSIPREFINLLLSRVDIVDVISPHLALRKKTAANFFACCPFHNEKTPSFSISQAKQFYYCFGCGAHGNAIDFVMEYERLSFPEAVEALAKQIGLEVPKDAAIKRSSEPLDKLYAATNSIANKFYDQMRKSPRAINYLKSRGIDGRITKEFLIGYAPHSYHYLANEAEKNPELQKNLCAVGLIIKKTEGGYYDRFRDRIIFPIQDYRGRVIGFGGRIIDQGEPKYLNSPENPLFQKGHELYGLYHALKAQHKITRFLIVEGYMDVISLFQQGISYAVATLGTATSEHHIKRLVRYTSELVFCFDGDQAGRSAAWRALQVIFPMMHDNLQVRFLFLPDGEDPDSLVKKEGRKEFENRIVKATPLSLFFLQKISTECDMNSLEGRARFAAQCIEQIKQLAPSLFQSMLLDEIAKRSRIPLAELEKQFSPEKLVTQAPTKTKLLAPVKLAIALLLQNPELAQIEIDLPDSDIPGALFLAELTKTIRKMQTSNAAQLLEHWRNQKERDFMVKLLNWEHLIPEEGIQNEFLGAIRQLRLLTYDIKINYLLTKGANAELTIEEKNLLNQLITDKKLLSEASA